MKLYNGNRNKLKIIYQNVPGTLSKVNMITTIQSLLDRIDPDVLAIAEPDTQDIDIDWSPYILIPGKIKNGTNMRLNILIKFSTKRYFFEFNIKFLLGVTKIEFTYPFC